VAPFDGQAGLGAQAVPDVGFALEEEEQGEDEHPEFEVMVGHGKLSMTHLRFYDARQRKRA